MKIYDVRAIANGYGIYCGDYYLCMFKRKENADYIANLLDSVKSCDSKQYVFPQARKKQ